MKQQIFTIQEAVHELEDIIEKHNVQRLLVVHGKKSYTTSHGNELIFHVLRKHIISVAYFSDFSSNPRNEDVQTGADVVRTFKPDAIVAVGGGSAMDVAKLVRYAAEMPQVPLVAIPTTSGTGAEVTQFAVCYVDGKKESIDHADILPEYSILIPALTMANNRYLTACTGFDALAQAMESYWNIHSTKESELYAVEAIRMLWDSLNRFSVDPDSCMHDYNWREQMMYGAHLAGEAINITRTTAPHAMSYVLTSKYGYPHGHGVALTFPYFFEKNIRCTKDECLVVNYEEYVARMRSLVQLIDWSMHDNLFVKMKKFVNILGLGYDAARPYTPIVVERGVNLQRAGNNPMKLSEQIIKEAVASIR